MSSSAASATADTMITTVAVVAVVVVAVVVVAVISVYTSGIVVLTSVRGNVIQRGVLGRNLRRIRRYGLSILC